MNTFTKEERITYWKKRIMDHTVSCSDQVALDFKRIYSDIQHINLDQTEFNKAFAKISEGFSDFTKAIATAKEHIETPKIEPTPAQAPINTKAQIAEPVEPSEKSGTPLPFAEMSK